MKIHKIDKQDLIIQADFINDNEFINVIELDFKVIDLLAVIVGNNDYEMSSKYQQRLINNFYVATKNYNLKNYKIIKHTNEDPEIKEITKNMLEIPFRRTQIEISRDQDHDNVIAILIANFLIENKKDLSKYFYIFQIGSSDEPIEESVTDEISEEIVKYSTLINSSYLVEESQVVLLDKCFRARAFQEV